MFVKTIKIKKKKKIKKIKKKIKDSKFSLKQFGVDLGLDQRCCNVFFCGSNSQRNKQMLVA